MRKAVFSKWAEVGSTATLLKSSSCLHNADMISHDVTGQVNLHCRVSIYTKKLISTLPQFGIEEKRSWFSRLARVRLESLMGRRGYYPVRVTLLRYFGNSNCFAYRRTIDFSFNDTSGADGKYRWIENIVKSRTGNLGQYHPTRNSGLYHHMRRKTLANQTNGDVNFFLRSNFYCQRQRGNEHLTWNSELYASAV